MSAVRLSERNAPELTFSRPESDQDTDAGRAEFLTTAFREHRITMYSVARQIVGDEAAADVVQDVFLRVWREQKFDASRSSIRTYLMTVTRSVAIDHLRRNVAVRTRDDRHERSNRHRMDVDDSMRILLENEARDQVTAAVRRLSAKEREVIMIAFHDRLTYREIGVLLDIPEGTVKSRIRLALVKLRFLLGDYYTEAEHRPTLAERSNVA